MADAPHRSVMLDEVVEAIAPARMREAAWRSIVVGGEGEGQVKMKREK